VTSDETLSTDERIRLALADRFTLHREIGRGAAATVYLARDLRHDREVALKVLRSDIAHAVGRERFEQEIRIEANLQHPGILPLYESGSADGILYYVMPYMADETLRRRLEHERQLPVSEAARLARAVLDSLAYAHGQGIVHRDIKPENILLDGGRPIIADFGIARVLNAAGSARQTSTGLMVGTPTYMAPEQAAGTRAIDGRTDLYAVACVLYEMLTGEPPFSGATPQAVIARHLAEPPRAIHIVRPAIPRALERAVMRGLNKVPADRFAGATEFIEAIDHAMASGGDQELPRFVTRTARRLAAGIALLTLAGAALLWQLRRDDRSLDPNRIAVFPLHDSDEQAASRGSGEDASTYIGHVLEGTVPLRWEEARDWSGGLTADNASDRRRLTRGHRAGYYIDGSILRRTDSVTVVLRLFDVLNDSLRGRAGVAGAADASVPLLGARAAAALLPSLLAPGSIVDAGELLSRPPAAIAQFLQGERAYRVMDFGAAFDAYSGAVRADSSFALAALKAARAAEWQNDFVGAAQMVALARTRREQLVPRAAALADGLALYYAGEADSALAAFEEAATIDPAWTEATMAMGEVYFHQLPNAAPLDSLGSAAFVKVLQRDSLFLPAIFHLAELSLQRGDTALSRKLVARVASATTDTAAARQLDLMWRCARGELARSDWSRLSGASPDAMMAAAKLLATSPHYSRCAADGFAAVVHDSAAHAPYRYYALLGLQGIAVLRGDDAEVQALLGSPEGRELHGDFFYLHDALVRPGLSALAQMKADELGQNLRDRPARQLLLLGVWRGHRGDAAGAKAVAAILDRQADTAQDRTTLQAAAILHAHVALASGDTVRAMALLAALHVRADQQQLVYSPWQSLGYERLLLARLLAARGDDQGVLRTCAALESSQPIVFLLYRFDCDTLRATAAERLGDKGLARRLRSRLAAFRPPRP
jgi:serine/threonine-protein kinase